jgi:hypothetical protein
MSSSSLPRSDRRAALLAGLLVVLLVVAYALQWAGSPMSSARAAGPQLNIVAVASSTANRQVTLVAECRPALAWPILSEYFSVTAGNIRLPTHAVAVISDRPAVGLVVDAAAAGATASHAGVSGAANFLLQMPLATRTVVVADTKPPTVLSPLHVGATDALRALSAVPVQSARDTSNALTLVLHRLPSPRGGLRVVVLQTSASDAGGETADHLVERLTTAHAVLAVVTANTNTDYWSRVTAATGGVLMVAQPSAPMAAFDDVAAILRTRYVLTFPLPGELPARVSVQVNADGRTAAADAVVPAAEVSAESAPTQRAPPDGRDEGAGLDLVWLMLGAGAVVVTVVLVVLQHPRSSRRHRSPDPASPEWTQEQLSALLSTVRDEAAETADAATTPHEAVTPNPPPAGEDPRAGVRIFDVSNSVPPQEIASQGEPPTRDPTDDPTS